MHIPHDPHSPKAFELVGCRVLVVGRVWLKQHHVNNPQVETSRAQGLLQEVEVQDVGKGSELRFDSTRLAVQGVWPLGYGVQGETAPCFLKFFFFSLKWLSGLLVQIGRPIVSTSHTTRHCVLFFGSGCRITAPL